jgi:hypothetical protein
MAKTSQSSQFCPNVKEPSKEEFYDTDAKSEDGELVPCATLKAKPPTGVSRRARSSKLDRVFNYSGGGIPLIAPLKGTSVFRVQQSKLIEAFIVTSTSVTVTQYYHSLLTDIANYANYGAVFDQYKIEKVEFWTMPRISDNSSVSVNYGLIASVIDYDDSSTLSSIANATAYDSCLISPCFDGHFRSYCPRIAIANFAGAASPGYSNESSWIDCGSSTVQHYGLKFITTVCSNAVNIDAMIRLTIAFRSTH